MKFITWISKGISNTIHDIAFLMALVLTVGPFFMGVALIWVLEGQWLPLSFGVLIAPYVLYYVEEKSRSRRGDKG